MYLPQYSEVIRQFIKCMEIKGSYKVVKFLLFDIFIYKTYITLLSDQIYFITNVIMVADIITHWCLSKVDYDRLR